MAGEESKRSSLIGLVNPGRRAGLTGVLLASAALAAGCGGNQNQRLVKLCAQKPSGTKAEAAKAAANRAVLTTTALTGAQKIIARLSQPGSGAKDTQGTKVDNAIALKGPDNKSNTADDLKTPQLTLNFLPTSRVVKVSQNATKPNPTAADVKKAKYDSTTGMLPLAGQSFAFRVGKSNTIVHAAKVGQLDAGDYAAALRQPVKLLAAEANIGEGYSPATADQGTESGVYFPGCDMVVKTLTPFNYIDGVDKKNAIPQNDVVTEFGDRAGLYADTANAINISGPALDQTQ